MRLRILLGITIGLWLAGTLFMWQVAMKNFAVVESVLAEPPAGLTESVSPLTAEQLRPALRYQASEANRLFFSGWGWTQIPLALATLALTWMSFTCKGLRAMALTTLLIALFLQLHVVPETIRLGELIDFDRSGGPVEETFWTYHHLYTGFDMLKFLLLLGLGGVLARKS